jgi:hypothetical protein
MRSTAVFHRKGILLNGWNTDFCERKFEFKGVNFSG